MNEKDTGKIEKINQNLKEKIINFLDKKWVGIGLIVLISTVIYYNSLNVAFIFDDGDTIVENPDIKRLSNIKTKLIYPYSKEHKTFKRNDPSRPLTYLTFTLNYHFGKLNPFGYHLFNLIIHILTSILVFFLARKILFYTYKKYFNLFPLLVALFFAVHPINTEVVVNICRRSTSLATFFYLLSLLFFIKTFEKNKVLYIFSLIFFILSFFSKQTAATLPLIVLIFDYIFLSNFNIKKVIQKKSYHIPFWFILIGFLLFRYLYLGGIGLAVVDPHVHWSNYTYFITQFYVIVRYFQLLFIPIGLSIDHLVYPAKAIFEPKIIFSFFIIIGIFILVYKISRKKTNISKIVLFSTLWFFITLSPSSSFIPLLNAMADRRVYISGFGFYLVIISVYFMIFSKDFFCTNSFIKKRVLLSVIGIHILLLSGVTIRRNMLFQNPVLLWQEVILRYPHNYKAHNSLGILYFEQKKYDKTFQEYQKALEINPDSGKTHNNLGILYKELGEYDKALQEYQKAIELNPEDADPYINLGVLYYKQKKYDRAFKNYQKSLQREPNNPKTYNHLGILYEELEQYDKAFQSYQKAIQTDPYYADAHHNLGLLYHKQKKYYEAIQEYQKALQIKPNNAEAYNNLGVLYYKQKKYNEAIQKFQKAILINPNYVEARNSLGLLYYSQKEYRKALQEFEVLLKLLPDDKNVKDTIKILRRLLKERSST